MRQPLVGSLSKEDVYNLHRMLETMEKIERFFNIEEQQAIEDFGHYEHAALRTELLGALARVDAVLAGL